MPVMKKKWLLTSLSLAFMLTAFSQFNGAAKTVGSAPNPKPKLVVGLVIDQMRWDYLYRFSKLYSANGFNRLLTQGHSFENTFIPYTPTYTAAGHACVYTGSVPAINGIMGNFWYDKRIRKNVYCTDDSTVLTIGSGSAAGKMSPENLWANTIGDELRLSNNFQSKVIGISLKDRGAILPAGHSANAAYWYDESVGKFITSSFYMKELPKWVNDFNAKDEPARWMSKDWNTIYPAEKYLQSVGDDNAFEAPIYGETSPAFPHKLPALKNKYSAFKYTPFSTTFSFDFARAAIENEKLGTGTTTDMLALSISTTDYIGHSFGPNSLEVEDTYYRLDQDIASFLQYLDTKFGKGNYLVFLTADHGAAHIPGYLKEHRMPAGIFDDFTMMKELNSSLALEFGMNNIIEGAQNYQFYLNIPEIEKNGKDLQAITRSIIRSLKALPFVVNAFELDKLEQTTLPQPQKYMMANGFNPKRSGDIMFTVKPAYFDGGTKGTTHGLWNPYDAHIPNIWFGWQIKPGKTYRETYMTDIAPTIAAMLKIQMPNGNVGKVLEEVVP
jgi:predicted AlkP superfamily pyrophosphatase or phosphodiesterase